MIHFFLLHGALPSFLSDMSGR